MSSADLIVIKAGHGFDHLDVDGDGELSEQDHVLMGQRLARALDHPSDSPAEQRLVETYLRIWRDMHLPTLAEGRTSISRDEFVASCVQAAGDPQAASAALGSVAETFVEIADLDADGRISPQEYRTFMHGHCPELGDAAVDTAFAHLDLDGDGHLSVEEFVRAVVEYWTSDDPDAPGNWWLGPLPG